MNAGKPHDVAHLASVGPFHCASCGRGLPEEGFPFRCPHCGGVYDYRLPLIFDPLAPDEAFGGIERYRRSFPLPDAARFYSLGEGNTPLVDFDLSGRQIYVKSEYLNPTGSFKDRGTAVLISALVEAGVREALEDSSGNAGASFAAYAARSGIRAKIFIPDYASGPKRQQIEAYGAEVVRILGPRSEASAAVQRAAEAGLTYASHAYLPHGLAGMATLSFEIVETLGEAPGALILPVGQGTLLLGAQLGFEALLNAGVIDRLPQLIGVQAQACAPLWAVFTGGASRLGWVRERETVAEGIRILHPLRGDAVLSAIERSSGRIVAVEEEEIHAGRDQLARRGFYVEPTSAVVWPALNAHMEDLPDPIVLVLTGSGFKNPA